jgi:signal transduction histidine kinase
VAHVDREEVMKSAITLLSGREVSPRAVRAHEMKNAMSVIWAVSRLVEGELSDKSRERIGRLKTALWRLRDLLTEDLNEEANDAPALACREPARVTAIVEGATERVVDRAAAAHVELFVQCGGGELLCDERALGEAVFNLLSNAVDASAGGGGVFLATYEMDEGDQYWIIQDTGKGIPARELAWLGQPFCSAKPGGSGLGLAIARTVVAAHGGLIRVESFPGAGTTVSVWLPKETEYVAHEEPKT